MLAESLLSLIPSPAAPQGGQTPARPAGAAAAFEAVMAAMLGQSGQAEEAQAAAGAMAQPRLLTSAAAPQTRTAFAASIATSETAPAPTLPTVPAESGAAPATAEPALEDTPLVRPAETAAKSASLDDGRLVLPAEPAAAKTADLAPLTQPPALPSAEPPVLQPEGQEEAPGGKGGTDQPIVSLDASEPHTAKDQPLVQPRAEPSNASASSERTSGGAETASAPEAASAPATADKPAKPDAATAPQAPQRPEPASLPAATTAAAKADAAPTPTPTEAPAAPAEQPAAEPQRVLSQLSHAAINATAAIAARVIQSLEGRSTRFEMALTPEELGRVDVSLEIDSDGQLAARLAFDNPAAATELRGRADELRRQLEDAGFRLSQDSLQFAERDGSERRSFEDQARRAFAGARRLSDDADIAVAPPRWMSLSLSPDRLDVKV